MSNEIEKPGVETCSKARTPDRCHQKETHSRPDRGPVRLNHELNIPNQMFTLPSYIITFFFNVVSLVIKRCLCKVNYSSRLKSLT